MSGHWHSFLILGICLFLSLVLYTPALNSYFVAEDLRWVGFDWSDVILECSSHGVSTGFRPGAVLYFVINNAIWGRNYIGHHMVALFIHSLVGWLLYLIVYILTGKRVESALAAMLFVGAPVHSEAVIWLAAAANTGFSGLIFMLAVLLWINKRARTSSTVVAVTILYLSAVLVKETTIILPALLLLLDFTTDRLSPRKPCKIVRQLASYLPLALVPSLYILFSWNAGIIKRTIEYGINPEMGFKELVWLWSLYARDLFLPISKVIGVDPLHWLWLSALFIGLHLVCGVRWAALWVPLTLLPGATVYGERLSYLAVAGFSVVLTTSVARSARWLSKLLPVRHLYHIIVVNFIFLLLPAQIWMVHQDAKNWTEAGKLTWNIPRRARALVPEAPAGAKLFFSGLPDNVEGAYAFRHGLIFEVRYVYGDPTLDAYRVISGPDQPEALSIASIKCEAETPRFFFKYHADSDELRLVSPYEFGANCP